MKPAREPVSSRPKPCASLKKPHASCPFAAPCGPRRKKNDRSQRSAFPSKTSRFALSILAHRGSAFPWLVNDRAALRLQIFCVLVVNPCNYFIELKPPVVCCTRFRPTTFFLFFSERTVWEGGGMIPDFFFCCLFPVQQTTSEIGDYCVK